MNRDSPLLKCELPIEDVQVIAAARGSKIRGVLVADGRVNQALNGDPGEYSVSSIVQGRHLLRKSSPTPS